MSKVDSYEPIEVFVLFKATFDMQLLDSGSSLIASELMSWGADKILKKYYKWHLAHIKLEHRITFERFSDQATCHSDVSLVERVGTASLAAFPSTVELFDGEPLEPWHLKQLGVADSRKKSKGRGFGVHLGIVDSGISKSDDLPSTDVDTARSIAIKASEFWECPTTRSALFRIWLLAFDLDNFLNKRLLDLKQFSIQYGTIESLRTYRYLKDEIIYKRHKNAYVKYPIGCPNGIKSAATIEEITLREFKQFMELDEIVRKHGGTDESEFAHQVIPSFQRELFDRDYPQVISGRKRRFENGNDLELFHELLYQSRLWHRDVRLRLYSHCSKSFVDSDQSLSDYRDHGTAVAGSLVSERFGLCPDADISVLKVFSSANHSNDRILLDVIEHAIDSEIDVLLIGVVLDPDNEADINVPRMSESLRVACNDAESRGMTLVAPVGQRDESGIDAPAAYESVIAVASFTPELKRSDGCNYGKQTELAAYGGGVAHGTICPDSVLDRLDKKIDIWGLRVGGGISARQGTCFAASQVAGAAVVARSLYPRHSAQRIREKLHTCVDRLDHWQERTIEAGFGVLNLRKI